GVCHNLDAPFGLAPLGRRMSPPATAPATTHHPDAAVRRWITPIVFGVGSGAIIVLALGLVIAFTMLATEQNNTIHQKIDTLLNGIFGAVLPIFATWVGTVRSTSRAPTSRRPACSIG